MNKHLLFALVSVFLCGMAAAGGPGLATGIKIGEATQDSALVWVRLTKNETRVPDTAPLPLVRYRDPKTGELTPDADNKRRQLPPVVEFPGGCTADELAGAAPGAPGEVRILLSVAGSDAQKPTDWLPVEPARDFTRCVPLTGLSPATKYRFTVETRGPDGTPGQRMEGAFRTAPAADTPARILFTVTTCHHYPHMDIPGVGFKIHGAMRALDPDFFVHTGDILYYDELAKSLDLARWHWARMFSLPSNIDFNRQTGGYFMKDDHDTWQNDCWPGLQNEYMGTFTFAQGQAVFLEQVPMGERTYRNVRWGRDLEIWMVEGRDFRSPNNMPDGPEKSIWGPEQKAWFKRTVAASDATFRVLISPTPLVGPDRDRKNDNHANNGFKHEGDELRAFIASQKNMVVANGDRHWQYASVDKDTGLREFSCGSASNEHAGGWPAGKKLREHRYLNVIGGFLSMEVDRPGGVPTLTARFHDVDGQVMYQEALKAQ